jgi:hypothetical protein
MVSLLVLLLLRCCCSCWWCSCSSYSSNIWTPRSYVALLPPAPHVLPEIRPIAGVKITPMFFVSLTLLQKAAKSKSAAPTPASTAAPQVPPILELQERFADLVEQISQHERFLYVCHHPFVATHAAGVDDDCECYSSTCSPDSNGKAQVQAHIKRIATSPSVSFPTTTEATGRGG